MVRKALSILILACMVLHCAGRLGVLSSLYQHRHTIATAVGLISEKPITTCQSDYFQLKDLNITADNDRDDALAIVTLEITLFFQSITDFSYSTPAFKNSTAGTFYTLGYQHNFFLDIFHPPQA